MKHSFLQLRTIATALTIFSAVALFSCKKDVSNTTATTVTEEEASAISEENSEANSDFDDVAEMGLSVSSDMEEVMGSSNTDGTPGINSPSGSRFDFRLNLFEDLALKVGPCTNITVYPADSSFPKTVTVDYAAGCICKDGKYRAGKVVMQFTAPIRKPNAVLTITFDDFRLNRKKIEGTKIVKNKSEGTTTAFGVEVIGGKVSWPNGRGFTFEAVKMMTQIKGMDTRKVRDDVYKITGRTKTVYANGTTVNKNTETPLIKAVPCPWISDGVLKIKINDRELFINYGVPNNGECDNKALLKWANGEKIITLPL
jgi:hypothetical protein